MRFVVTLLALAAVSWAQAHPSLRLERTIELPDVQGRIDHMSLDVEGRRLFVAALGNNTVEVIDTAAGKRVKTITGMAEPQGVVYVPEQGRLYVANGHDGSVRAFDGKSFAHLKTIAYGDDADNLRYDPARRRVYVGYGNGGLGEIDADGNKAGDVKLDSHPEAFQLAKDGARVFVNLPKSRKVAVVDRQSGKVTATWSTGIDFANYPMALNDREHRLYVVTRMPARLLVFNTETGAIVEKLPVVGDCDDVFYDAARKRIYAIGGEGGISVFEEQDADHYRESAKIATVKGARTGFFSPELNLLFVGIRRQGSQAAAIRVYVPAE